MGEARGTVFDLVLVGSSGGPADGGIVHSDVACHDIGHTGTVGSVFEGDVVGIGIPNRGGSVGAEGYILTITSVVAEDRFVRHPVGGEVVDIDSVDVMEGTDVGRVGHHAHVEDGRVGGAAGSGPEGQLQRVDGMGNNVHGRQDDNLVVAVGAGGGG